MKKFFRCFIQYYLKFLTRIVLWRHKPMVIAIAGSTDKTFVKDKILEELAKRDNLIRGNPRSFNTEIGLPLAVLFLPSGYSSIFKWVDVLLAGSYISFFSRQFPRVLVLEMGVDKKGDMKYLLSMVKPQMAVITNINKSFPDKNANLDIIASEMEILAEAIPEEGFLALNGDDKRVRALKNQAQCRRVLYGTEKDCQAKIFNIQEKATGQTFDLAYQNKKDKLELDKFGRHNVFSFVAAKLIVQELNKKLSKNDFIKKQKQN